MSRVFLSFIFKKMAELLASLFFLVVVTFFLLKFLPGGPFEGTELINPIVKQKLLEHWQLDQPWAVQAWSYLRSLMQGDLGVSMMRPDRPVLEIIAQGFQNTLLLNGLTLVLVFGLSLIIALLGVRYRGTWIEAFIDQSVVALLALPSLFWGPLLIFIFGFYFDILPVAFLSSPVHYILPMMTLSTRPLAALIRLLKSSMVENLSQDYVRTARAKGVGGWRILTHHVLRNSLIPFLSYGGPVLVSLLSGSFLVELLFAVPGLGSEFVAALDDRDYTLIMGLTLVYGAALIVVNSFIEILMTAVDPRLREDS